MHVGNNLRTGPKLTREWASIFRLRGLGASYATGDDSSFLFPDFSLGSPGNLCSLLRELPAFKNFIFAGLLETKNLTVLWLETCMPFAHIINPAWFFHIISMNHHWQLSRCVQEKQLFQQYSSWFLLENEIWLCIFSIKPQWSMPQRNNISANFMEKKRRMTKQSVVNGIPGRNWNFLPETQFSQTAITTGDFLELLIKKQSVSSV